jgi:hypothetical protein
VGKSGIGIGALALATFLLLPSVGRQSPYLPDPADMIAVIGRENRPFLFSSDPSASWDVANHYFINRPDGAGYEMSISVAVLQSLDEARTFFEHWTYWVEQPVSSETGTTTRGWVRLAEQAPDADQSRDFRRNYLDPTTQRPMESRARLLRIGRAVAFVEASPRQQLPKWETGEKECARLVVSSAALVAHKLRQSGA